MQIEYRDYWKTVREIVEEAIEEAKQTGLTFDEAREYAEQTCDGHEWCIYYGYAFDVLRHSADESAWFGTSDTPPEAGDTMSILTALACAAFRADVMQHSAWEDAERYLP